MNNQKNIIVIGGGAAGMIAAIAAAKEGCAVSLYEKNEKLGKKIFITGKGRCNVTNAGDMDELFGAEAMDIKSDIQVLEMMMVREGLLDGPMYSAESK